MSSTYFVDSVYELGFKYCNERSCSRYWLITTPHLIDLLLKNVVPAKPQMYFLLIID